MNLRMQRKFLNERSLSPHNDDLLPTVVFGQGGPDPNFQMIDRQSPRLQSTRENGQEGRLGSP